MSEREAFNMTPAPCVSLVCVRCSAAVPIVGFMPGSNELELRVLIDPEAHEHVGVKRSSDDGDAQFIDEEFLKPW